MGGAPSFLVPIWSAMADVTKWFDWEALGAIGTVGALWFAVVQSTRSGRAERAKAEGLLLFLISLMGPVESVSIHEEDGEDQLKELTSEVIELEVVRRALRGLEALPLSDASSIGVVQWVMALPLALKDIENTLVRRSIGRFPSVYSSIQYVQEANSHFYMEHDKLRGGLLINAWRFLQHKLR